MMRRPLAPLPLKLYSINELLRLGLSGISADIAGPVLRCGLSERPQTFSGGVPEFSERSGCPRWRAAPSPS